MSSISYFAFQLKFKTGKPRRGKNKAKGDCCFMSSSATQGWVGVQARVRRKFPEALRNLYHSPSTQVTKSEAWSGLQAGAWVGKIIGDDPERPCVGRWVVGGEVSLQRLKRVFWAGPLSEMWAMRRNGVEHGSVNYGLPPAFVREISWERSHAYLCMCGLWLPCHSSGRTVSS